MVPALSRRAETGTLLKRLGADTALKRLFTGVFDLSVVASSYDNAAALIPGGNLLLAVLQKGHPTETNTVKGTRKLLTTDNYLAQLSHALQCRGLGYPCQDLLLLLLLFLGHSFLLLLGHLL